MVFISSHLVKNQLFSALFFIIVTVVPVYGQNAASANAVNQDDDERSTWRLELANDFVFKKDNQITSGWSVQRHSAIAENWDTLANVPDFVRYWGKSIPLLTKEGLVYRSGIALGQIIQTPDDITRRDLIKDDVPYAGALTLQATWYAFNDNEFRGFEIITGVVGPASLAEQTQKTAHQFTGDADPEGWDNQLDHELVINLNYMFKQKIWRRGNPAGLSFDTAINGNIGLGNMITQASAALELRFGHNISPGFVYVPDPIGFGMHYIAARKPPSPQAASCYVTLVLRGSAFAHNILLDGNTFRDSHSVDKEPLVGFAVAGIHYERKEWGIHYNLMGSTDVVDRDTAPAAEGFERLATIDIEWKF